MGKDEETLAGIYRTSRYLYLQDLASLRQHCNLQIQDKHTGLCFAPAKDRHFAAF